MTRTVLLAGCLLWASGCSLLFSAGQANDGGAIDDGGMEVHDAGMEVALIPESAFFENVVIGQESAPVLFTAVAKANTAPLTTGGFEQELMLVTDECEGTTLLEGEFCVIEARFVPASGLPAAGDFEIGDTKGQWAGRGIQAGAAQAIPSFLGFGLHIVGSEVDAETIEITNTGETAITPHFVLVGLEQSIGRYQYQATPDTDACDTLNGGESCTLSVTYKADMVGAHPASLEVRLTPKEDPPSYSVSLFGATRDPRLRLRVFGESGIKTTSQEPTVNDLHCEEADNTCLWPIPFGTSITLSSSKGAAVQEFTGPCVTSQFTDAGLPLDCTVQMDEDRDVIATFPGG